MQKRSHSQNINQNASTRQLRVGELFRKQLMGIFVRDNLNGFAFNPKLITVTQMVVSPDLRHAIAYVMPLGGKDLEGVVKELNIIAPKLRGEMSKGLRLKYVPVLKFKADTNFHTAENIDKLLNQEDVLRDLSSEEEI